MVLRYFESAAHAVQYAKFRPGPPQTLINHIIKFLKKDNSGQLKQAVDVGCGTGLTTEILQPHFSSVIGLDISQAQINEAIKLNRYSNVSYKVCGAENLPFKDSSLNLLTAGQASHWFDLPKFYNEVNRVLVEGGVLALYGYSFPKPIYKNKSEELYAVIDETYKETYEFWGKERRLVDNVYTHPCFNLPFEEVVRDDSHFVEKSTTVHDFCGYITTWSGYQNLIKAKSKEEGNKVLENFIESADGTPTDTEVIIRINFFLLMGKKVLNNKN